MKIFNTRKKINKRGALELSINAVVILILAIAMLGLGLGFIRGLFGGTVEKFAEIGEQLEEEQRTTLMESPDQITFLTSKIQVKGREKAINFAIRNNRPECIQFNVKSGIACFDAIGSTANEADITFDTFETREVESGKSDVLPLQISVAADAVSTIYSCKIRVDILGPCVGSEAGVEPGNYASKNFEVEYVK